MTIKPIIIQKTANGYVAAPFDSANGMSFDLSETHVFRTLNRSVSYERDGITDFLEAHFNPPEPAPVVEFSGAV